VLQKASWSCSSFNSGVSSWLASRLKRDPQLESTSQEDRSKPKSESEGQQNRAGTLEDSKGAHLFLAKYRDVLLVKDDVTRIITSVQFDETRSVWTVNAARANIHKSRQSQHSKS
jgi:hypothetical protein